MPSLIMQAIQGRCIVPTPSIWNDRTARNNLIRIDLLMTLCMFENGSLYSYQDSIGNFELCLSLQLYLSSLRELEDEDAGKVNWVCADMDFPRACFPPSSKEFEDWDSHIAVWQKREPGLTPSTQQLSRLQQQLGHERSCIMTSWEVYILFIL